MSVVIIWGKGSSSEADRARVSRVVKSAYSGGIGRTELDVLADGRLSLRVAMRFDGRDGTLGTDVRETVAAALREAGYAVIGVK